MGAGVLATQGVRATATMMMPMLNQTNLFPHINAQPERCDKANIFYDSGHVRD